MEHENNNNQKNLVGNDQNHFSNFGLPTNADQSSTRSLGGNNNILLKNNYSSLQRQIPHLHQNPQNSTFVYHQGTVATQPISLLKMDKCGGNEIKSVVFQSVCWDVLLERHTNLNCFDQNTIMRREDSRKELIISSDKNYYNVQLQSEPETVLDPMFVITSGCAQTLLKIYDGLQSTEKDTITQIYNELYINDSTSFHEQISFSH